MDCIQDFNKIIGTIHDFSVKILYGIYFDKYKKNNSNSINM